MKRLTIFITGTDTGAGKTIFACLLAQHLQAKGFSVAALKPVCSGGRGDAKALHAALDGVLTLDEINPWHFHAPIAPLAAARVEKRKVKQAEVLAHALRIQKRFPILIVEGAGGVLSPLGEDFDSRDLIKAARGVPVVVAPNRLGAINQVLLTLTAMPRTISQKALVVLMAQRNAGVVGRGNLKFLAQRLGRARVHELPWIKLPRNFSRRVPGRRLCETLNSISAAMGM